MIASPSRASVVRFQPQNEMRSDAAAARGGWRELEGETGSVSLASLVCMCVRVTEESVSACVSERRRRRSSSSSGSRSEGEREMRESQGIEDLAPTPLLFPRTLRLLIDLFFFSCSLSLFPISRLQLTFRRKSREAGFLHQIHVERSAANSRPRRERSK